MSGAALVEVVLPHVNGLTRDAVVNTFAFTTTADPPSTINVSDMIAQLEQFYNLIPTGFNAIAGWLNDSRDRTALAAQMKIYDIAGHLDGSAHGSPIATAQWSLGPMASGGGMLPAETCCVLTSRAAYGADPEFGSGIVVEGHPRPRARDRSRLYIGPLTSGALSIDPTTKRAYVNPQLASSLTAAASTLAHIGSSALWSVWSRRNAILKLIIQGWVDDAFDTHRKRGEDPIMKHAWS